MKKLIAVLLPLMVISFIFKKKKKNQKITNIQKIGNKQIITETYQYKASKFEKIQTFMPLILILVRFATDQIKMIQAKNNQISIIKKQSELNQ